MEALIYSYEQRKQGLENLDKRWRAAGDGDIDGQDRRQTSDAGVASTKAAASARAISHGNNPLGFGSRPMGSLQGLPHVVGHWAGHRQNIRVPW
jgi:hypothetical protein